MEKCFVCFCCGEEHGLETLQNITIKGKQKKICPECVSTIKGII